MTRKELDHKIWELKQKAATPAYYVHRSWGAYYVHRSWGGPGADMNVSGGGAEGGTGGEGGTGVAVLVGGVTSEESLIIGLYDLLVELEKKVDRG